MLLSSLSIGIYNTEQRTLAIAYVHMYVLCMYYMYIIYVYIYIYICYWQLMLRDLSNICVSQYHMCIYICVNIICIYIYIYKECTFYYIWVTGTYVYIYMFLRLCIGSYRTQVSNICVYGCNYYSYVCGMSMYMRIGRL